MQCLGKGQRKKSWPVGTRKHHSFGRGERARRRQIKVTFRRQTYVDVNEDEGNRDGGANAEV